MISQDASAALLRGIRQITRDLHCTLVLEWGRLAERDILGGARGKRQEKKCDIVMFLRERSKERLTITPDV
jgi:hypothetical protein